MNSNNESSEDGNDYGLALSQLEHGDRDDIDNTQTNKPLHISDVNVNTGVKQTDKSTTSTINPLTIFDLLLIIGAFVGLTNTFKLRGLNTFFDSALKFQICATKAKCDNKSTIFLKYANSLTIRFIKQMCEQLCSLGITGTIKYYFILQNYKINEFKYKIAHQDSECQTMLESRTNSDSCYRYYLFDIYSSTDANNTNDVIMTSNGVEQAIDSVFEKVSDALEIFDPDSPSQSEFELQIPDHKKLESLMIGLLYKIKQAQTYYESILQLNNGNNWLYKCIFKPKRKDCSENLLCYTNGIYWLYKPFSLFKYVENFNQAKIGADTGRCGIFANLCIAGDFSFYFNYVKYSNVTCAAVNMNEAAYGGFFTLAVLYLQIDIITNCIFPEPYIRNAVDVFLMIIGGDSIEINTRDMAPTGIGFDSNFLLQTHRNLEMKTKILFVFCRSIIFNTSFCYQLRKRINGDQMHELMRLIADEFFCSKEDLRRKTAGNQKIEILYFWTKRFIQILLCLSPYYKCYSPFLKRQEYNMVEFSSETPQELHEMFDKMAEAYHNDPQTYKNIDVTEICCHDKYQTWCQNKDIDPIEIEFDVLNAKSLFTSLHQANEYFG